MINELTPEQEALLPVWREKWLQIGLSCEPCDVAVARPVVDRVYRAGGLQPPAIVLVADSPMSSAVMGMILRGQVSDQVSDQVWDQVWDRVSEQVREQVWDRVWGQVWGAHDAGWLSYYSFFQHIGVECDVVVPLMELARQTGWWFAGKDVAILQHRHTKVNLVDGRLHCEDGPSVEYRDGLSVWSIEGVRVDEQVVMCPETQTVEQIDSEGNEEIRRVRIERFGVMRYVQESGASVLDQGRNDVENTYEMLVETKHGQRLVTHCPSTGRKYFLGLPARVETREQAQRLLAGNVNMNVLGRT